MASRYGQTQRKKHTRPDALSVNPRHALTKEERNALAGNRGPQKPSAASKLAHYATVRTALPPRRQAPEPADGASWWTLVKEREGFTAEGAKRTQE